MKKLVLLDGHARLHRAYHALPNTFTDAAGHPTNALFGFASIQGKSKYDLDKFRIYPNTFIGGAQLIALDKWLNW